ncbi:hypothetical protein [Streptomyces otsuchiensis]|uniref:hypothetical protein n=1 Tax=Streptomyces otsuchiensis TaxID=2681388 RepID=UPI000CD52274|nr:hypothetical protein [Streptomyces otsuchiensis]
MNRAERGTPPATAAPGAAGGTGPAGTPGTVDLPGAGRVLGRGGAVVLPNPEPLTFVVAATRPPAVNAAKGRPVTQPVALWAHHPATLARLDAFLALDTDDSTRVRRLLAEELLTLLVPLRPEAAAPPWLSPASRDGWVLLFGARWSPLRPLLEDHPLLYVSSANRTGHPPAATTAEALGMFPAGPPVLAVAPPGHQHDRAGAGPPRRATTTLRVSPGGGLALHRHGAQDHPHATSRHYLDHLRTRYG